MVNAAVKLAGSGPDDSFDRLWLAPAVVRDPPARPGQDELARAAGIAYRARRVREKLFGAKLFSGPAWDMLLYLYLASHDGRGVAVTEACCAAGVPVSTGLRHVQRLVDRKYFIRKTNPNDGRGGLLYLSSIGKQKMADFLARFAASAENAAL